MAQLIKLKTIKPNGVSLIKRLSIYFKNYSIKIHLIPNNVLDYHTHPWDYKSFLIIPYKEYVITTNPSSKTTLFFKHKIFTLINRNHTQEHSVILYTIFGIKIPALTIGKYSKKKQLCSFCKEAGYCKQSNH